MPAIAAAIRADPIREGLVLVPKFASFGKHVTSASGRVGLTFDGADVARVTHTVAAFWNGGEEPINADEVSDPIVVVVSGPVMAAEVLAATSDSVRLTQTDADRFRLDFETLAHDDGLCFHVLHEGEETRAVLAGALDGVNLLDAPVLTRPRIWPLLLFVSLFLLDLGGGAAERFHFFDWHPGGWARWAVLAGFVLFLVGVLGSYSHLRAIEIPDDSDQLWSSRVPSRLLAGVPYQNDLARRLWAPEPTEEPETVAVEEVNVVVEEPEPPPVSRPTSGSPDST